MFVFRREDLPADPVFPADLGQLGYFINANDQIRKTANPDEEFQFKINRNDRWNEVQRGAMNETTRKIVLSRLQSLGLTTLHLPFSASSTDPRVPILVSRNLSSASRIVVVFGEPIQDLGIWAYRSIGVDGINAGSAVDFATALLAPDSSNPPSSSTTSSAKKDTTALILANTGQLLWHCGSGQAVTNASWLALPRRSAVDSAPAMSERNAIPWNANWQEHIACVFEDVLSQRGRFVRDDAVIDVVGVAEGGLGAVQYLGSCWQSWSRHVTSLALTNPLHFTYLHLADSDVDDPSSFAAFMAARCRAYVLSDKPLGTPVQGFDDHGCNCYSGGEALNIECIMPSAWRGMVDWWKRVHGEPRFAEDVLVFKEIGDGEFEVLAGSEDGDEGKREG